MPLRNLLRFKYVIWCGQLELPGYNLVRTDNPANTKRGGVCIYYHNSLPLNVIDIQFLTEYIKFEIRIDGKVCNFLS